MATEKKGEATAPVPKSICPTCKSANDLGSPMCKKCGEILKKNPKGGKVIKTAGEYDPTEGSFSPSCIIIPAVLILAAIIFFLLAVGTGPKRGTCGYNCGQLAAAAWKYSKAHPERKMSALNQDELMKPGKKGQGYIKEKFSCPVDPSATYEFDTDGATVICTTCSKKKR